MKRGKSRKGRKKQQYKKERREKIKMKGKLSKYDLIRKKKRNG